MPLQKIQKLFIILPLLFFWQACPLLADESDGSSESNESSNEPDYGTEGVVTSMQAFSHRGEQTADSLALAAEYALNNDNINEAIKLCRSALEKDDTDLDIHMTYAKVLHEKLKKQKVKDPTLFNLCVREYLIVYRTEIGPEKNPSFHGISPLGHFFEDEDRSIPARQQLISLTGRAPKPWETDTKYLKWVNRPTTEVSGKVMSSNGDGSKNETGVDKEPSSY